VQQRSAPYTTDAIYCGCMRTGCCENMCT